MLNVFRVGLNDGLFAGMTGMLVLDGNGDREPDYWITDMHPNGTFLKIAEVLNSENGQRVCIAFLFNCAILFRYDGYILYDEAVIRQFPLYYAKIDNNGPILYLESHFECSCT